MKTYEMISASEMGGGGAWQLVTYVRGLLGLSFWWDFERPWIT